MVLNEENVGKLQETAVKRKERLAALKKKRRGETSEETSTSDDSDQLPSSQVLFRYQISDRAGAAIASSVLVDFGLITKDKMQNVIDKNYRPETESLSETALPQVEPSKVENMIEDQLKHSETSKPIAEVEINNLAPKKLTYDLRRGIQSQLDKLERRTDKAIAELIRERLKEGRQQDFLMAVNVGAKAQQKHSYDSDDEA